MPRDGKGEALAFRAWQPRGGTNADFTPNVNEPQVRPWAGIGVPQRLSRNPQPWGPEVGMGHGSPPAAVLPAPCSASGLHHVPPKCPKREQKSFLHPKADIFNKIPREKLSDGCTSPLGVTSPTATPPRAIALGTPQAWVLWVPWGQPWAVTGPRSSGGTPQHQEGRDPP